MSARVHPRRADAGFTLVEALVSLFVFSLIAAGSTAMLMQGVASQRNVIAAQDTLRELQTARALLQTDAAHYVARSVREGDGARRPPFVGGDESAAMAFASAGAALSEAGDAQTFVQYVRYDVREGELVRVTRVYLDAAPTTPETERVLLSNVSDIRFQFFDGVRWVDQWAASSSEGAPPRAIALSFTSPRYGAVRLEALVGLGG
ncbi:MAG: type II secretion system protein GspJ [Alphaproteobacteria bacterium]|nr:type II secretion system protein GspJ [Alphaproteobacteria bacterium]